MASTTFTILTPALTGTTITAKTGVASSETITISGTTAQGCIDGNSLFIRATNTNTTETVTLSIGVGTEGSDLGIGAATVTLATEATAIIGGQGLDTARFGTSGNTIVITSSSTGPCSFEAYQAPRASE